MRKAYKNLLSDTVVFAAGSMLAKLIQFFLLPMYTALLTTEQYGIGELVNNMAELLYPICCLGVYEGVFRFALDKGEDKASVFTSGVIVALALVPIVMSAAVVGYAFTGFDYTWQLTALCLVDSLKMICLQFSKGLGRTRLYAASGVIGTVALCVFGYAFLGVTHWGVLGYLYALLASQVVQLGIVVLGARMWRFFSPSKMSRHVVCRLLRYSLPMIPNALAWWFVNLSGRYIVLFSQGAAIAGLYTAASKLPSVMVMLVTIFQQAWQIFSAREYNEGDCDESFGVVFRVYTTFLLCSGSLVVALTEPLSRVMLSGEFFDARLFVPALMFGAIINGYSTYFGTIYNAAKRNSMIFVTTMIGAFANIVIGIALASVIGAWGPVVGSIAAYSIISISRAYDTRKLVKVKADVPYQVIGITVLLVEVILLSLDMPHATLLAICCSMGLMVFSGFKCRLLMLQLVYSFRKER